MTTTILIRFNHTAPDDPSGIAEYTYAGRTERVLMGSREHADRMEAFMQHLLHHARRQARTAAKQPMVGAANSLEQSP